MSLFSKISFFLSNPKNLASGLLKHLGGILSDKLYVQFQYRISFGKKLNLKCPQTFNEKLNWLKLYYRNPLWTTLVDKAAVKGWVANKIGSQYVIPTLFEWNTPDDINWDKLPEQFVLKTTQGGGSDGVIVCKDKNSLDIAKTIHKLKNSMQSDPYSRLREWPYKDVPHKIIAEKYMEDTNTRELRDYKFFCFNGVIKSLFVATGRQYGEVMFDYFDENFNHLDIVQTHPMSGMNIQKPDTFDEMKQVAQTLSEGIPQVRVDLYEVNGKVYFGEMTFFHHGGITPFHPESWDYLWGSWIELPNRND